MITARKANFAYLAFIYLVAALAFTQNAWAASGNVQICQPSANCKIGEFLYDDSYAPLTTTSCKITSIAPDESTAIDNEEMYPPTSDGWYSYDFAVSASAIEGVYRTQICCIAGEKTFATTDVDIASDEITVGKNISTDTILTFSSTDSLPTGLAVGTRYYAINVNSTTIQVAASQGGGAINFTNQGVGVHTINSDNMCLDKTFEVKDQSTLSQNDVTSAVWNADRASYTAAGSFGEALQNAVPSTDDIAYAVWNYSGRTLSGFGTLIADIWSNPTRSVTTFGTLIADIWNNTSRSLTGASLTSGSLATQSDVSSVKTDATTLKTDVTKITTDVASLKSNVGTIQKTTNDNRLLLEKAVNKPIIKNFLEEQKTPDLSQKIQETKTIATKLSVDAQHLQSSLELIRTKWKTLSQNEITDTLFQLLAGFGSENDTSTVDSFFGNIAWMKNKWEWQIGDQLFEEIKLAKSSMSKLQSEIKLYGKSQTAYSQVKDASSEVNKLSINIGTSIDTRQDRTLFGRIQETQEFAQKLELQTAEVDTLLISFNNSNYISLQSKINTIVNKVSLLNRLSNRIQQSFFAAQKTISPQRQQKNQLLAIRGILFANQEFLARKSNDPLASTWLEEGSIMFKSLVTNPSALISQTVPITLYLPLEVKKEDVLKVEDGFSINFDPDKKQLYITGEISLNPSESKTVEVEVEDIWKISDSQIASLRKQADELYKPLVNTSYFGQAVTIKSDIDVSLDKVLQLGNSATTPEAKIRAYQDAQIELNAVDVKIEKLKELVSLASSAGSLVGFVGGAQAIAVWGLIIILVAGFVFLALYMRVLQTNKAFVVKKAKIKGKKSAEKHHVTPHHDGEARQGLYPGRMLRFALVFVTFSMISAGISGAVVYQYMVNTRHAENTISKQNNQEVKNVLGQKDSLNGQEPLATMSAVKSATSSGENNQEGKEISQASAEELTAYINDTTTGFLRVRKTPGGIEIGKVNPGDKFPLIDEKNGWLQVELEGGDLGWVSKKYVTIKGNNSLASFDDYQ
ncbi:MAG: SH3 domain-containing protein [Patescibacteria group bacterium]